VAGAHTLANVTKLAATASMLKELNERTVFEAIRAGHPISRAEISRQVGISKPTVSAALTTLLDAGLVRETRQTGDGPTYGALFFEPVPEAGYVLCLDIGARYLRGVLAALDGDARASHDVELATLRAPDADGVVTACARLRDTLLAEADVPAELGQAVVVAAPGVVVDPRDGVLREIDSVPGFDGFPLAARLREALEMDTPGLLVQNDVHLAALGEQWRGVGRDVDDFAFLSIGTGTGAGLILRGELHRGHAGAAGEIDFAIEGSPNQYSPYDPCASAFVWLANSWLRTRDEPTSLRAPVTSRQVFDAARHGDELALRLVAEEARRIAVYAAPLVAVADPELIVLGGGIGLNGDLLLAPVRAELERRVPYPPRVECSALGDRAVLVGALALGVSTALENVVARGLRRRVAG
jgi:predicted NBD/HSP70 family sugar kinase